METAKERLEKNLDKIKETSIYMGEVRKDDKTYFMNLANEQYDGHYGYTLKFLINIHKGWIPSENSEINAKINILAQEIEQLKEKLVVQKEEPKTIRMLSGKKIKVNKLEE